MRFLRKRDREAIMGVSSLMYRLLAIPFEISVHIHPTVLDDFFWTTKLDPEVAAEEPDMVSGQMMGLEDLRALLGLALFFLAAAWRKVLSIL